MVKTYVLDTNVLLQSPNALFSFEDNNVVIPDIVLEELDDFKKGHKEINVNAREVARKLYALKELICDGKTLFDAIDLENGGTIRVCTGKSAKGFPDAWEDKKHDNNILKTCLSLIEENEKTSEDVILITKDIYLGIKADRLNIKNETFTLESVKNVDQQYTGQIELYAGSNDFKKFAESGELDIEKTFTIQVSEDSYDEIHNFERFPNQFVILHNVNAHKSTLLCRISKDKKTIMKLIYANSHPYGVSARNASQLFLQEALMDDVAQTPLVIIKGGAGTAKTFYSLAVGLQKVIEDKKYRKILVCRPNVTMDEDLGFLPGTEQEKLAPFMRPIKDNLEVLVDSSQKERYENEQDLSDKVGWLFEQGSIVTEAVGFLRGRSINQQYIIIDEAQNLTPNQVRGIITRAGEATKIILAGDPNQIDSPFLDSRTNGLSYASELMKGSRLCAQITMKDEECVRSDLAKDILSMLKNYSD